MIKYYTEEMLAERKKVLDKRGSPTDALMDILNYGDWDYKSDNGAIRYSYHEMHGCCAFGTIHNVSFGNIMEGKKEVFYKEVEEHLLSSDKNDYRQRGALSMSDAVGGECRKQEEGQPCIYDMCTYLGWDMSKKYYNPRSGNDAVVFYKERGMKGKENLYPIETREERELERERNRTEVKRMNEMEAA